MITSQNKSLILLWEIVRWWPWPLFVTYIIIYLAIHNLASIYLCSFSHLLSSPFQTEKCTLILNFVISETQLSFLPFKVFLPCMCFLGLTTKFKSSQGDFVRLSHFEFLCPSPILLQYIVYILIIPLTNSLNLKRNSLCQPSHTKHLNCA